mmetsp:Transcript_16749/g.25148  ORF Transcript_16749/g.25148 Transcript_16749/m.25148 type:complete len:552 (-) Transcript_16749:122-1777(-)
MESITDLQTLYNTAEWAVYHGYHGILSDTINILESRGGSVATGSVLDKRLKFSGYLAAVKSDIDDRELKLIDSLTFLDDLYDSFKDLCKSDACSDFHWVRIRQLTAMQLGILCLKKHLDIPALSPPPADPREIAIPAQFCYSDFKKEVESIFDKYKKYPSTLAVGKVEDEHIRNSMSALLDIFQVKPMTTNKVKYRAHYILHHYCISGFRHEAQCFAKMVENEVLPPPPAAPGQSLALFSGSQSESSATPTGKVSNSSKDKSLDAQDAAAARALGVLRKQDWTRDERDEKGPYASQKQDNSRRRKVAAPPPEESSDDTEEQQASSPRVRRSGRLRGETAEATELALRRNQMTRNNSGRDPLVEAIGVDSVKPVVSVAGQKKLRSQRGHVSKGHDNKEEEDEGSDGEEKGGKDAQQSRQSSSGWKEKRRLIDSRVTSSTVDFGESDVDSEGESPEKLTKRMRIEAIEKKKFPRELEGLSPVASPGTRKRYPEVRLRWSADEEEAFMEGIRKHGVGSWAEILQDPELSFRFCGRTNVNLKDKYRNLKKIGVLD